MQRKSGKNSEPIMIEPASSSPPDEHSLVLDGNLDLTAASELARSLLASRGFDLTIDATSVRHLGAQCGQVLVSAAKTWQADQREFRFAEASAEFHEGLRLLGLRSVFEIMEPAQ